MEKAMYDNLTSIMEHYGVESLEDVDGAVIGQTIAGKLAKNCPYALNLIHDSISEKMPMYEPDSIVNCENLKTGEYYYLTPNSNNQYVDTTFVSISEDGYLERMKGGRTYSRLSLEWRKDCKFRVTFIESNDPLKKGLSKPGDKYDYEIIKETPTSIVVRSFWNKEEYHVEFVKIRKSSNKL